MRYSETIAIALVGLLLAGCVHTRGGAGAAPAQVCFSPTEVAFIRGQINKCKGKAKRCRMRLEKEIQLLRLDHQRDTARLQSDLNACQAKQRALAARRCPTCLWKILGAGIVGLAVGAVAGGIILWGTTQ